MGILCICALLSLFFTPVIGFTQRGHGTAPMIEGDAAEGMRDGRADAIGDVNGFMWFGCGCTFNYLGVGAALIAVPSPKQERFMGKSQDYIWSYTKQYKKTRRGQQTKWAAIGCATGTALMVSTVIVLSAQTETCNIGCGMDEICDEWDTNCDNWNDNITNCGNASDACGNSLSSCGDVNCSTPECSEPSCSEPSSCGENSSCGSSSSSCGSSSSSCSSSSSNYSSQQ